MNYPEGASPQYIGNNLFGEIDFDAVDVVGTFTPSMVAGLTFRLIGKLSLDDPDSDAVFDINSVNGIGTNGGIAIDNNNGTQIKARFFIPGAATKNLEGAGGVVVIFWALLVKYANETVENVYLSKNFKLLTGTVADR